MKHPIPPSARDKRYGAPKMRLPFDPKSKRNSPSAWIYRHRVGLLVTVVVYLSAIILFLSYRIIIKPASPEMIAMEFQEELPQPITEQLVEPEKEVEQIDMPSNQKMRNRTSDANSKLDASIRDSKRTNASEIYEEAERVKAQMLSGSDAFNKALQEIEKSGRRPDRPTLDERAGTGDKRQTASYKGSVSVVYDLVDRNDSYLHVPAYQCQNAGMVVVSIIVNRNGRVISATVDKTTSSEDPCIGEMSVKAALASSFNASQTAPDRQRGTITYTFKAQ